MINIGDTVIIVDGTELADAWVGRVGVVCDLQTWRPSAKIRVQCEGSLRHVHLIVEILYLTKLNK